MISGYFAFVVVLFSLLLFSSIVHAIDGKAGRGGRSGKAGAAGRVKEEVEFKVAQSPHNIQLYNDSQPLYSEFTSGKYQIAFVKIYASWCGHCKKMADDWNELANHYADNDNIIIGEIDAGNVPGLMGQLGASGFPTLFLFAEGNKYKFNSGRTFENFKKFVDGDYKREFVVKPKSQYNAFDWARNYIELQAKKLIKVVQNDGMSAILFLFLGFVLQKILSVLIPLKPTRKAVEDAKNHLRSVMASKGKTKKATEAKEE